MGQGGTKDLKNTQSEEHEVSEDTVMVGECRMSRENSNCICFSIGTTLAISSCEGNKEPFSNECKEKIRKTLCSHSLVEEPSTCVKNHYISNIVGHWFMSSYYFSIN